METLSVRCNHCGAPLQVAEGTRYVTCQFCQSHLEVRRTDSSIFTEEVAKLAQNTEKMADSLEVITLQNEIERLDREHGPELAAQQLKRLAPGAKVAGGLIGFIIMGMVTAFGIFFAVSSSSMGAPFIFPLFGGGFALIGIISIVNLLRHAATGSEEEPALGGYAARRAELVKKLAELTKS